MREPLEFTAFGAPKGQPRARAVIRGKHAGVYDPGSADSWKFSVRSAAKGVWDGVGFEGPLKLIVLLYFERPKGHFTKKGIKPTAPKWRLSRPDVDNAAKAVMDALTTLGIWKDDAQVCDLIIHKEYHNGTSHAVIRIEELVE